MKMVLAQILSGNVKPEKGPRGQLQLFKECDVWSFCGMCGLLLFHFKKGKKCTCKLMCFFKNTLISATVNSSQNLLYSYVNIYISATETLMIKNPKRFFLSYKAGKISPILCLLEPFFHFNSFPPTELSNILNLHTLGLYFFFFFASIAVLSNYSAVLILVTEVSFSACVTQCYLEN